MKYRYHLMLMGSLLIGTTVCCPVTAEDWHLTDPALAACVTDIAKKQSWYSVNQVTNIRCHSKDISSLQGLEKFSALKSLSLHNNELEEFTAEMWPQLETLNVAKNKLQQLELKNLSELKQVFLFGNNIKSLELENLPRLEQFKANSNKMTSFIYSSLPALRKIYLFDNELEVMDIHQLPSVKYMDVRQNPMPDELYEEMDRLSGVTVLHDGNEEDWQ